MFNKKEEIYYAVIFASAFVFVLIGIIIYALLLYLQRKRKHLADKAAFSNILLSSQLEIKEQTLRYLGTELHDNLGQVASLVKINLNTLQLANPEKAAEKIEDTKELIRQLITDIKSLSVSLGADRIMQKGLVAAIETEVHRLNRTGEFTATFLMEGGIQLPGQDVSVILFRMAQEALNNMVKHSNAKHINVSINVTENLFTLAISDDGDGFDVTEAMKKGGAGLKNLQNRAELIKASIAMISSPGNGTSVTIALPL